MPRLVSAVLRAPLLWKLLLANAGLVAVAGLLVVARESDPAAWLRAPVVLTVLGAGVVNGLLVWLALRPIERLIGAARDVGEGRWPAPVPASLLADRRIDRLRLVLNEMLDAVAVSRARQRELSRRVLQAEERERERVARELYAGTAQTMAEVLVRLRLLQREVGDRPECRSLELISEEVRGALEEVRGVARRLRPPELDELGVRAALEAHARRLTDEADVRVLFHGMVGREALSDEGRLALFRIVQEAITNSINHAGGSSVQVRFLHASDGVVAEVEDDGCGFLTDDSMISTAGGLGLTGMQERARHVGGAVSVDSVPGRGTRIRLVLPRGVAPGKVPLMPAGAPT